MESKYLQELATRKAKHGGLWDEISKRMMIAHLESTYKPEHIRHHGISDVIPNGEDFLIKWYPRIVPLTDEELAKRV